MNRYILGLDLGTSPVRLGHGADPSRRRATRPRGQDAGDERPAGGAG